MIAADLGKRFKISSDPMYFSSALGFALKFDHQTSNKTNPVIYEALKRHEQGREAAEDRRLLYVTLTRARDYLVLTTAASPGEDTNCAYNLLDYAFTPLPEGRLRVAAASNWADGATRPMHTTNQNA